MLVLRDILVLPLDSHPQLPFRLPLQIYRHELLEEQRLEPSHLSVVLQFVIRRGYVNILVLPVIRSGVSRLKAYNPFVGSTLERDVDSPCQIWNIGWSAMSSSSSKNGSQSSSGSSRDCRLGDPPTLNPLRPCFTVVASCGVLNVLGRRPSRGFLPLKLPASD
ncbi:hypothetical protein OUZ56_026048 [Daphnia magna]|uniref:Uncharacterized protein n=1 Tax=Daphnia magna TaxID=35525 RepID=A0ABQ9ZM04_9CRUS|nr:hypothetical protein OUZ56_026048 [Daphnia magna]